MELPPDLKAYLDIGLGAISLLLWMRQGKANAAQLEVNKGLTTMVKDHDDRIARLEGEHLNYSRPGRKRVATKPRGV